MHALHWLNERGPILRETFQPIKDMHFYRSHVRSRYRGLCDLAVNHLNLNLTF